MSHPGSHKKKKKRVSIDDDELSDTGIEMADDCEIQPEHDLEESSGLLSRKRVIRKKSCMHNACRICMGIMATAVFTFMLIQLWSNYGDEIKKRVFSPQVIGAGSFTSTGTVGTAFGLNFHKFENETLHLNITKPTQDLVQLQFPNPQPLSYEWDDDCLKVSFIDPSSSVSILVWSI